MAERWTTEELPGTTWDPEPDEDDGGPWCLIPTDLGGQGADVNRLAAMTTVTPQPEYL